MANTLQTYCEQANSKMSTSGIAIVSVLHGYSTQCSTSGLLNNSWAYYTNWQCVVAGPCRWPNTATRHVTTPTWDARLNYV